MKLLRIASCFLLAAVFLGGEVLTSNEHEAKKVPVFVTALPVAHDADLFTPTPVLLTTKTVYGFLDFVTTVGNTVMVFKPSKPAQKEEKTRSIVATSKKVQMSTSTQENQQSKVLAVQAIKHPASRIESSPSIFHFSNTIGIEGLFSSDNIQEIKAEAAPRSTTTPQPEVSKGQDVKPTSAPLKQKFLPEVEIQGSMVQVEEVSSVADVLPTERLQSSSRKSLTSSNPVKTGVGFVSSTFSVVQPKQPQSILSQVSVRVGGKTKLGGSSNLAAVPKPLELRMQLNVQSKQDDKLRSISPTRFVNNGVAAASKLTGLVSKTSGTIVRDGLTTVHETSVVGTVINGQYAQVVVSTSNIFQESPSDSVLPASARGTFEVVTELPSIKGVGSLQIAPSPVVKPSSEVKPAMQSKEQVQSKDVPKKTDILEESEEHLPSLESLFKNQSPNNAVKRSDDGSFEVDDLPRAHSLVQPAEFAALRRDGLLVEDSSSLGSELQVKTTSTGSSPGGSKENRRPFTIQPSSVREVFTLTAASRPVNAPNIERRAGLATPFRQRQEESSGNSRPLRRDNRWRYNPSPKPKVNIRTDLKPTFASPSQATNQKSGGSNYEYEGPQNTKEEEVQEFEPTEVTTLRVHTVTPAGYTNINYEVATIKSPFIMRLGAVKTTRFVTLTKTFTRLVTQTPAPAELLSEEEPEILLDPSLPLTENILATTTPYENILKDSSDTATLPAIIVATESEVVPLETITETFSTTEFMMKTSVLPYLRGDDTSLMTLTQSYYITRIVIAVKTIPPSDLYQFIPSNTLKDFSTALQEAGSEHNEHLLPGELEFSENDEYADDEERREKVLPPPPGFGDSDLSNIGSQFDPDSMVKPRHPELQPSLVSTADYTDAGNRHRGTPPLRNAPKARPTDIQPSLGGQDNQAAETPALTPEQLQQLALFRYMNPYAAAAGLPFGYPGLPGSFPGLGGLGSGNNGAQVIQTSRPVLKTTEIVRTDVVPIWDGVKTIFSTISRTLGTTVVTETEYGTSVSVPTAVNPFQQFTVTSSPVTTEIMTTSTELRVYRIIFRAQTTFTTVTSTSVFPTVVTSFVTSTIQIQPTAFPGLFGGSFGFPSFVG